jgi:hypothetical protein
VRDDDQAPVAAHRRALKRQLKCEGASLNRLRVAAGRVIDRNDAVAVLARDLGQADSRLSGGGECYGGGECDERCGDEQSHDHSTI